MFILKLELFHTYSTATEVLTHKRNITEIVNSETCKRKRYPSKSTNHDKLSAALCLNNRHELRKNNACKTTAGLLWKGSKCHFEVNIHRVLYGVIRAWCSRLRVCIVDILLQFFNCRWMLDFWKYHLRRKITIF